MIEDMMRRLMEHERRLARLEAQSVGDLNLTQGDPLTIASGVITVTHNRHLVDTEASAATDNLTNIAGGRKGQLLTLGCVSASRVPTLVSSGDLRLAGNFALDSLFDQIMLECLNTAGTIWQEVGRCNYA